MKKIILALAGLLSLFIIKPTLADQSCYINSSAAGIYTVPNDPITRNLNASIYDGPVSQVEGTTGTYDYTIPFRGSNPIGCKSASPWDNSVHVITDSSLLDTKYVGPSGQALFKTSVPGIVYSATLWCAEQSGCGSNHDNVQLLYPAGGGNENVYPSQSGFTWESADTGWSLRLDYFRTPDFHPEKGVSTGHSIAGTIGQFRIGPAGQPVITFTVTDSTLNFYIPDLTCSIQLQGGSNNVSLGDYFVSDIKKNSTQAVPFSFSTQNCYATRLTVKMVSGYPSSVSGLLAKSAGSASGVAVKIMNTDHDVQMKPDGSVSVSDIRNQWGANTSYNYSAQVVPDGSAVKSGDFKTAATFSITYE
ncbi:fimbrial protein [Enterobacter ludwigii]|nr:fimbrial protein [Enterobacter cloacae]